MKALTILLGSTLACADAAAYSTPNTNANWTMADLVAYSAGAVTGSGTNFQMHDDVWVSPLDTLTIAQGTIITRDDGGAWPHFVVQGRLVAAGTEAQPILITSGSLRGLVDTDFDRPIELSTSASGQTVLNWVICENADIGLASFTTNSVAISNCTFRLCHQGAYVSGRATTFFGCNFVSNGFPTRPIWGAGCGVFGGTPSFIKCLFAKNITGTNSGVWKGGGLDLELVTNGMVSGCTFTDNKAQFGGGVFLYRCSSVAIQSNSFAGNDYITYAVNWNGLDAQVEESTNILFRANRPVNQSSYYRSSGQILNNVLLQSDHSPYYFPILRVTDCSPLVAHNWIDYDLEIWGNASPTVANNVIRHVQERIAAADPVLRNNLLMGDGAGLYFDENSVWLTSIAQVNALPGNSGNITGNSLFNTYTLTLPWNSPCVDAGFAAGVTNDIKGNPRPYDGNLDGVSLPDIGPAEFNLACDFVADKLIGPPPLTVVFTATVLPTNNASLHCFWDFNHDGVVDVHGPHLFKATNTYSLTGVYSVSLLLSNLLGETSLFSKLAYIGVGATAMPTNRLPADGATNVAIAAVLQSSLFSSTIPGALHTASRWQVSQSADFASLDWDIWFDTANLTNWNVPSWLLRMGTRYVWRVAYHDSFGGVTAFSTPTWFQTSSMLQTPMNIFPVGGETNLPVLPTLQASPFAVLEAGHTHGASQWQVSSNAAFTVTNWDSGISAAATNIALPTYLFCGNTYYWRVRYRDTANNWSHFSTPTAFTTAPCGPTLYVAANGAHVYPFDQPEKAARTIQAAIDAAANGNTVLVFDGLYLLTNEIVLSKGLLLRSVNGHTNAIISGGGATRCVRIDHTNALLDGFTITQGVVGGDGGGIYSSRGSIRDCLIVSNSAAGRGGGTFMTGLGSLSDSIILRNSATGAGGGVYAYTQVSNCLVAFNTSSSDGGGVYLFGPTPRGAIACTIASNSSGRDGGGIYSDSPLRATNWVVLSNTAAGNGGGVYLNRWGTHRLTSFVVRGNNAGADGGGVWNAEGADAYGCAFEGNTASNRGGGAYWLYGRLDRCIMRDNEALEGGGLYAHYLSDNERWTRSLLIYGNRALRGGGLFLASDSDLAIDFRQVSNTTISQNTASEAGGGVYGTNAIYENCIFWSNSAPASPNIPDIQTAGVFYSNCLASPLPPGDGNLEADPLFMDPDAGDFSLRPGSPCLNAGANSIWMTLATDLVGFPRLVDGRVDIGAYESPWLILSVDAATNGTITPTGAVAVFYGSNQPFDMQSAAYFHLSSLETNSVLVPGYSNFSAGTFVWSNVVNSGNLRAAFAPNLVMHDTPEWWLASFGLSNLSFNSEAMLDQDGDGMPSWQEFRAGTVPTNASSALRIERATAMSAGGRFILSWQSIANKSYFLERGTNLAIGFQESVRSNILATPPMNTEMDQTATGTSAYFYRIRLEP